MKPNYEIRVGLFTLIALILLLWGWGWLKSAAILRQPQRFTVRFHDVAGLNKNATVNINGVRVGTVENIQLKSKGVVLVGLKITAPNVVVTEGSTITIQTLGLVGAKYIEVTLPTEKPGEPPPEPISPDDVVEGQDPVRVELVINELATKASAIMKSVKSDKAGTSLADALEHSGEAVKNINEAAAKLNNNMDKLSVAADSVISTSDRMGKLASSAQSTAEQAGTFFRRGSSTMGNIDVLATDLRGTAQRMNKILDNPVLTKDLRETAQMAKQTADTVAVTIRELNTTLNNEPVRKDLLTMLERLNNSTENIQKSVMTIAQVANDGTLRSDVKEVVATAKDALEKADLLLNQPDFKSDLTRTMGTVRTAANNVDQAAKQLSQVLEKRSPLLHLLFGRPGAIEQSQKELESQEKKGDRGTSGDMSRDDSSRSGASGAANPPAIRPEQPAPPPAR